MSPIQSIENRRSLPVLGKIRLGIKKQSKKGSLYPDNVEHFVLKDAPGVAEIYGETPKEIDIIFPVDDPEIALPTYFRWYSGGMTKSDGSRVDGKLRCKGNGPDSEGNAGVAEFYAQKDPVTGVVPTRPCLGEKCPDWNDSRGNRQCKPGMNIYVILPRVDWTGVYRLDTTSWNSIRRFHDQIAFIANMNGGSFRGIPLKMVKEQITTRYIDKNGKEQVSTPYIVTLKSNEGLLALHGEEIKSKLSWIREGTQLMLPSAKETVNSFMDDNYPVYDEGSYEEAYCEEATTVGDVKSDLETSKEVAADPEVNKLFDMYEQISGKKFSPQNRLISIRKKEGEADVRGAVIATLKGMINEAHAKANPAPEESPPPEVIDMPASNQSPPIEDNAHPYSKQKQVAEQLPKDPPSNNVKPAATEGQPSVDEDGIL